MFPNEILLKIFLSGDLRLVSKCMTLAKFTHDLLESSMAKLKIEIYKSLSFREIIKHANGRPSKKRVLFHMADGSDSYRYFAGKGYFWANTAHKRLSSETVKNLYDQGKLLFELSTAIKIAFGNRDKDGFKYFVDAQVVEPTEKIITEKLSLEAIGKLYRLYVGRPMIISDFSFQYVCGDITRFRPLYKYFYNFDGGNESIAALDKVIDQIEKSMKDTACLFH